MSMINWRPSKLNEIMVMVKSFRSSFNISSFQISSVLFCSMLTRKMCIAFEITYTTTIILLPIFLFSSLSICGIYVLCVCFYRSIEMRMQTSASEKKREKERKRERGVVNIHRWKII